ncbi:inositol monophosphatase family protein [Corynebacterium terpenotabidum]|uniref:Inositol-1-monophosphatase n=1 Tax=Corynebacterium terpenotabidum Y-11 TaxID=1200352 RepID=S4XCP4_9CORY|nr:inositol monophosphatase family protein [Corynebacterium terpenotabidum]AGP30902.1 hypothetical protein A606_06275 [Corynebacterium terpenotabidum Y-11]
MTDPVSTASSDHLLLTRETTEDLSPTCAEVLADRTPDQLRRTAVSVAVTAARHVRDARRQVAGPDGRVPVSTTKSSEVDPVTAVDRSSEALIRRLLTGESRDAVLGEEDGGDLRADVVTWVVDPIDGTVNFIYGFPASAVSIAATVNGVPVAAAVADIARRRVFSACTGGAAVLAHEEDEGAGRVLAPSTGPRTLATSLVGTGFSYDAERRARQAALLGDLLPRIRDIRRAGSAALDLCAVAAGALDAYYEHGLGPWDHAGGALIAARAGAVVHMPLLTKGYREGVGVVAASPRISGEIAGHVLGMPMPTML